MHRSFPRPGLLLPCVLLFASLLLGGPLPGQTPDATDVNQDGTSSTTDTGNTPPAMPEPTDVSVGSTAPTSGSPPPAAEPTPAEPPVVDDGSLRAKAEASVPPVPAILDLSAPDAAAIVFSRHGDVVAAWIATLGGSRDAYGNEITPGYMGARQPDFLDEGLKSFLMKQLAESADKGFRAAATAAEAARLKAQLEGERSREVEETYKNLLEEARAAKTPPESDPKADEAKTDGADPGDPKEDPSPGASGSEDIPEVPSGDSPPKDDGGSSTGEDGYDPNVLEISVDMDVQADGLHFGTINVHNKTDGTAGDIYTELFVDGGKVWSTIGNVPAGGTNPYGTDNAALPALVPLETGNHAIRVEAWSHNDPRRPKTVWTATAAVGNQEDSPSTPESEETTPPVE